MAFASSHGVLKPSQTFFAQLVLDCCNSMTFRIVFLVMRSRCHMFKHHISVFVSIAPSHALSLLVVGQQFKPYVAVRWNIVSRGTWNKDCHLRKFGAYAPQRTPGTSTSSTKPCILACWHPFGPFLWRHSSLNIWSLSLKAAVNWNSWKCSFEDLISCTRSSWHYTSGHIATVKPSTCQRDLPTLTPIFPREHFVVWRAVGGSF